MITAALNEGEPAPINVQVKGNKLEVLRELVERIEDIISFISAIRDVRTLQQKDQFAKNINIDRIKAAELGVAQVDAIKNMVSDLNSSVTFRKKIILER